jgi:hypothetical protein
MKTVKPYSGMLLITILPLLWCLSCIDSQHAEIEWERTFGGPGDDCGYSVQQTSDGGYIIAGGTDSYGAGSMDVWLLKTDANGSTVWTKTFGGVDEDCGYSVQQTSDGGYIVAGGTSSFGAGNMNVWLLKTDANGDTVWTKTFEGVGCVHRGHSVEQTTDGGYIAIGVVSSDVHLVKMDQHGDTLWTRTYGGAGYERGKAVRQTADGGYIIAGEQTIDPYDRGVYLVKTDQSGDSVWTKVYRRWGASGVSVDQTRDDGYVIVGTYAYTGPWGVLYRGIYLVKTSLNGGFLWEKLYGAECGTSVRETSDGGYVIAGASSDYRVCILKTDRNGDTDWDETYTGRIAYEVEQTAEGDFIAVGSTGSDVYLLKITR